MPDKASDTKGLCLAGYYHKDGRMTEIDKLEGVVRNCAPNCIIRVETKEAQEHLQKYALSVRRYDVRVVHQPWTAADQHALDEQIEEDIRCGRM